eukprot:CAMPEP_0194502732 /NCGR_PEP_ID=MMETSP0253-20130528/26871_1 /TAXON_ID=2966 /ORGANISM="Noctiluca scintillans" /LENGTH=612 /DNA_ID=CAMNT_0039344935 /DNA_START=44 /DNA_END=1879 /DNA_ORIENTATION=+
MHSGGVRNAVEFPGFCRATSSTSNCTHARSGTSSPAASVTVKPRNATQQPADETAEAHASRDPFFSPDKQRFRQARTGIHIGPAKMFGDSCEFVSLGCFCAVAHALQSLGLKQFTYPFDWNRSPLDGVVHCLETDFSDFLDYGFARDEGHKGKLFGGTAWGGSFWHHDLTKTKVRADFSRRTDRLFGRREVSSSKSRVFVRALNSSSEIHSVSKLQRALQLALPEAKIYLLVLLDLQTTTGLMTLSGVGGDNLLFGRIHQSLFAQCTKNWTIEKHSDAYADSIAQSVRVWSGDVMASKKVRQVASLHELEASIDPFDGGSTQDQLFTPVRVPFRQCTAPAGSVSVPTGRCAGMGSVCVPSSVSVPRGSSSLGTSRFEHVKKHIGSSRHAEGSSGTPVKRAPLPIGRARLNTASSVGSDGDCSPSSCVRGCATPRSPQSPPSPAKNLSGSVNVPTGRRPGVGSINVPSSVSVPSGSCSPGSSLCVPVKKTMGTTGRSEGGAGTPAKLAPLPIGRARLNTASSVGSDGDCTPSSCIRGSATPRSPQSQTTAANVTVSPSCRIDFSRDAFDSPRKRSDVSPFSGSGQNGRGRDQSMPRELHSLSASPQRRTDVMW